MSLINDMLRNLDAREARSQPSAASLPEPAPVERARGGRVLAAALACALGGAALAALWLGPLEAPLALADRAAAPARGGAIGQTPVLPDVSQAPALEADAAVLVRRFALEQTDHGTRLSLELSAPTPHRVARSDAGRALEVVLEGTRLDAQVPPLDLQRSPFESFDVEQRDGDLHLILTLTTPTRIQSGMQRDADGARLALDFLEAPAPEPPPAAASKSDAAPAPVRTPHPLGPGEHAIQIQRSALAAQAAGDAAGAEAQLREALALDPMLHAARAALASLLLGSGRVEDVAPLLDAGDALAPGHAPFALLRARLLLAQGDLAKALAALERSAPPLARDPEYHALHAALLSRTGEHTRAADAYARLVAVDGKRAAWWLGLGISLEGQARRGDALAAYREAARLASLDAEAQGWVESRIAALAPGG